MPYYEQEGSILFKAIAAIYAGKDGMSALVQAQQQINAIIPRYSF